MMGGKKAKFGIFSPAVYIAKIVLGEPKLNKLRGKAISLHSQVIGDFTMWAGAYHLRTKVSCMPVIIYYLCKYWNIVKLMVYFCHNSLLRRQRLMETPQDSLFNFIVQDMNRRGNETT